MTVARSIIRENFKALNRLTYYLFVDFVTCGFSEDFQNINHVLCDETKP